jgi:cell division protein FtsB
VKRTRSSPSSTSSTAPPRRHRRAVQYVLLFIGCVILVNALIGDNGLLAMMKAQQEYRELESALEQARTTNVRLREEARRLREDPSAIEEIARRDLGLVKPGEKLFIVKDIDPPAVRRPE